MLLVFRRFSAKEYSQVLEVTIHPGESVTCEPGVRVRALNGEKSKAQRAWPEGTMAYMSPGLMPDVDVPCHDATVFATVKRSVSFIPVSRANIFWRAVSFRHLRVHCARCHVTMACQAIKPFAKRIERAFKPLSD